MYKLEKRCLAILDYTHFGESLRVISKRHCVSLTTVWRWVNGYEPKKWSRRKGGKLHTILSPVIQRKIETLGYFTADTIRTCVYDSQSLEVSRSSVYRSLKQMKVTYKKLSKCRRHKTIDCSHPFMASDTSYDDAISFDESGFYWNDYPSRGWGKSGTRVPKPKSGPNHHVSLLLAVSREGVVHRKVLKGGVGGNEVVEFFRGLPDGRPVILDNPNIHRVKALVDLCRQKNIELRYTPYYSPWYNPVEFCFSEIKARYRPMRLNRSRDHISDILHCVDNLKGCANCFNHARKEWLQDKSDCVNSGK